MSATFASLRIHNYRIWFFGGLVANVGTWMQRIAQDWLVLTVLTDDSGVAVGITTALQFAPTLVLSAWAGLLADRVDRRALLVITQLALAGLAAGLGALVLLGHAELWHVYVFAAALGCVSAFDGPARMTVVADLVPPERISNAVGLNSASFNVARLVGPAAAGLLIGVVGIGWVFVINAVSFAGTIVSLAMMRPQEMRSRERPRRGSGQIREGVAYVRSRPDIVVIMVVVSAVSMFGLNFQLTTAVMARTEFGLGPEEYGVMGSVLAIGSLAGALMAARRERPRLRLVIGTALGFGVSTGVMAVMPTYELYMLACIPVGFMSLTMMTAANSAIQVSTHPSMRGRVMSLYMVVFLGATPVGSPLIGWVAETFGARWAIGLGSICALVVASGAALWVQRHSDLTVRYRLLERPHLWVEPRTGEPACRAVGTRRSRSRSAPGAGRAWGGAAAMPDPRAMDRTWAVY